ncbi:MBL fold metallo-hydrolase [Rhodothermus marinus]|uniref:MBL fold metallo-hydrolase n=1 Tax=Rhodothermus marinus TaxID=29549 RepID=UPI001FB4E2AE|nr:MBL fold metallo-hydrolase [Rhodothermus marinus]
MVDYLERNGLRLRHLLLTHGHIDHIFGCRFFSEYAGKGFWMHWADVPFLEQAEAQGQFFGVPVEPPPPPEGFLDEGDTITFGQTTWTVLHTPGHSPGSISFYDEKHKLVIVGDVLFQGSIGRTDLPGGSCPCSCSRSFRSWSRWATTRASIRGTDPRPPSAESGSTIRF